MESRRKRIGPKDAIILDPEVFLPIPKDGVIILGKN